MSRERINQAAFDNVTFAATIVSIVLAVISIVISVYASFSTYNNLGGLTKTEKSLSKIVDRLENLERVANDTKKGIKEIYDRLAPATVAQIEARAQHEADQINNDPHTETSNSITASTDAKALFTSQDIVRLQETAIVRVSEQLGLQNLMLNTHYRGLRGVLFDGIAHRDSTLYVIESRLYKPNIVDRVKQQFTDIVQKLRQETSQPIELVLIFITQGGNDIQAIYSHIQQVMGSYIASAHVTIQLYTFSQLQ